MTNGDELIPSIFDADNHYWETFTRHRDAKFADRGVTLVDVDGKPGYMFGEQLGPKATRHSASRACPTVAEWLPSKNSCRVPTTTSIAAPSERVWHTVSDVSRMGEFPPVCTGGESDDGITEAAEGAWFTGHDISPERSWITGCEIEAAERGSVFGFINHGSDAPILLVRRRYDLAPAGDGTDVTETWQVLDGYETLLNERAPGIDVEQMLERAKSTTGPGMETTLAALKRACES